MQLISIWYHLSDLQTEAMVNDSFSTMRFCNLRIEDRVPDHSTLSRFRKELTHKKAYDRMDKKINIQLGSHKLIVKGIAINHYLIGRKNTTKPLVKRGESLNEPLGVSNDGLALEPLD